MASRRRGDRSFVRIDKGGAGETADLLEKLRFAKWLAEEVVTADLDYFAAILFKCARRHRDDRHFLAMRQRSHLTDRFTAIEHRHAQIDQDQLWLPLLEGLDRLQTIRDGARLKADGLEQLLQVSRFSAISSAIKTRMPGVGRLQPQDAPLVGAET